jgi:hypothetical protein
MAEVTDPYNYAPHPGPSIVVHALRKNKRPVGFAPWPKERKKKKKRG